MACHGEGLSANHNKDSTQDRSSQIDMITDQFSAIIMNSERIPSSFSESETVRFEAGEGSSASEVHASQELLHGFSSTYQYSRLPDESEYIRILHLLPGERGDPIRVRLEPCSLSNRPSYEAISYAWGSKTDNGVVLVCEGKFEYAIEVPKSLHGALKQLRHHSDHRSIWADAICMNQADDQEKNHQVRLMRKIYQRAVVVVIWLGDDAFTCGRIPLFEVINQLSQRRIPPPEDQETWTALWQFYRRPWFWRVWCLQEAILAQSAKAMLGEQSTSLEQVGLAAASLHEAPVQTLPDDRTLAGVRNAYLMHWLSHTNRSRHCPSFLNLLSLTRPFMATDFRDKIYGILGIPTIDSDPDASEPFLQPDYTKTLPEVYIKCASTIVQKTRSLRLLSSVQHEQLPGRPSDVSERIEADGTLVKVPSWVPRWHKYFAGIMQESDPAADSFEASASMNLDSRLKAEVRGLELVTYGARITAVKSVSRIFESSIPLRHAASDTADEIWVKAFDYLKASTTDPKEALYALSTLLTAGRDWAGCIIKDREQHFADFFAFMYHPAMLSDGDSEVCPDQTQGRSTQAFRGDVTTLRNPNMLVDSLFRPRTDFEVPAVFKAGQADRFQETMRGVCIRRRLIVTENGHVGFGPEVTEPGDVVCILKEAPTPLLVRPEAHGDSFKLVGEAYIQGMMFGEIKIPEPGQIVLGEKPFVDVIETKTW